MKNMTGFSLIELLAVISIIVVLACLMIPNLTHWFEAQRASSTLHQLESVLIYARTEAIKRGGDVIVCPSIDGQHCLKREEWSDGYLVATTDKNSNDYSPQDILRVYPGTPGRLKLVVGRVTYLLFLPSGFLNYEAGHFEYCSPHAEASEKAVMLTLLMTGAVRYGGNTDTFCR